jgi:hypothetical protein
VRNPTLIKNSPVTPSRAPAPLHNLIAIFDLAAGVFTFQRIKNLTSHTKTLSIKLKGILIPRDNEAGTALKIIEKFTSIR